VPEERVIGVDVGGTKILAGLLDRDGTVERSVVHPSPTGSQDALLDGIAGAVEELVDERVRAVGFGVPSQIDQQTGTLGRAVNLPLGEIPFRSLMAERLRLPVAVDNDANVAAFAEWAHGAARGTQTMVMLTLGTGVGGGIVLGGRPYHGWAEIGHVVVELDGAPCQGTCSGRGHLESYVSGHAADRVAREELGEGADAGDLILRGHPALARIGRYLGAGLATLANIFDPEMIVVGGGFGVAAFELLLPSAREVLRREALVPAGEVPVVKAAMGPDAGLVGAGLIAFDAVS
jgi:glucokinase